MNARKITLHTYLFTVLFLTISTGLSAITITWTGAGDGTTWEDPFNWDAGFVPTGDDRVIIEGTANVILSSAVEARRIRLRDDAVLTVTATGQVTFPAANTVNANLILLVNDAQLINNGTLLLLSLPEEDGIVLDNRSTLTNNGSITIAQAYYDGIWLLRRSTLINNNMITVQSADENCIDAEAQSSIVNTGTILLQNALDDAVNMDDEAEFENRGTLRIENTDDNDAIDMSGYYTFFDNFGLIEIVGVINRGEGIEIDEGLFINRNDGIITMTGVTGDGILLEFFAEFTNRGFLSIELDPGTIDDTAIELECYTFFSNKGIIEITVNGASDAIELECEFAEFLNRPCGGVYINSNSAIDIQDADARFRNNGALYTIFDGVNNNEGTFRNDGIIEDPDGFMIAPNALVGSPMTDNDMVAPTITCPMDIDVTTDCIVAEEVVMYTDPMGMDDCNVYSVVCTPPSGSTFGVGTTMVTCVVTDQAGNTGECTFNVNVTQPPVDAPVAAVTDKAFCQNADLDANLTNTGVSVGNTLAADEKVVWVLTSAPAGSAYTAGDEFSSVGCGTGFANFGELAVANTSRTIRVQEPGTAPVGTYTFDAYVYNCTTGCISSSISGFSITVYAAPTVMITADPDGDLCLGQMDVQYDANLMSTDGGTYTYAWCAYNSGDGSGTCFNGFDDNTAAMPSRDWTSSAGSKSVGVMVTSDVAGCEAEDLYSFEVVAPTMLECPADIMATLVTDPITFDCATDIVFNHPMVEPGPCDPVNLILEITGPSGAGPEMVTPGAEYTLTVEELGTYTVFYNLIDAVGNTSSCSFDIIVDGLPCGWVDNGGIGDPCDMSGNTSSYDLPTETFTVTAVNCALMGWPFSSDQTAFVFTELCGDGEIVAQVTGISGTGFAGVMMRDSEAPDSPMIAMGTNGVNKVLKQVRILPGYPAFPQFVLSYDQFWVRIVRQGNQFMGFASTDGVNWVMYLNQQVFMSNNCLRVGLFTYSEKPDSPITATFNNVLVTEYSGSLIQLPNNTIQTATSEANFDLEIFPNPTRGIVTVALANELSQEPVELNIFNAVGQLVQRMKLDAANGLQQKVDLGAQTPGMYFFHLLNADGTVKIEKVILE